MWSSRLLLAFIKARPIQCKVYYRSCCCYYYFSTTLKKLSTHITSKKEKKKINFCFLLEKKVKKKAILQSLMAQPNGVDSKCPASTSPPPPSLLSRLWSSLRLQKSQRPTIIPPTPSSNASTIQRTQSERRVVSNGNTNNHQNVDIEGLCIKERPTTKQLQNQPSIRTWSTGNNDNGIKRGRRKGGPLAAQELHSISDHHHYDHLGNKYENGQASPILSSARPRTPKPAPRFSLNNSLTTMTTSTGSKPNNLRSKGFRPG